jgi:arginase
MTDWVMIGVPSSAGAHHAGQERAPAALRQAGLLERLRAAGLTIRDAGDLSVTTGISTPSSRRWPHNPKGDERLLEGS